MTRLARPARPYERALLRSSVEVAPIVVVDGIATVEARGDILARVAERDGFRRIAPAVPAPAPAPASTPTPARPARTAPRADRIPEAEPVDPVAERADRREAVVAPLLAGSVDALVAALGRGDLDDLLSVAFVAERSGKNRTTARRAILSRSRAIGVTLNA